MFAGEATLGEMLRKQEQQMHWHKACLWGEPDEEDRSGCQYNGDADGVAACAFAIDRLTSLPPCRSLTDARTRNSVADSYSMVSQSQSKCVSEVDKARAREAAARKEAREAQEELQAEVKKIQRHLAGVTGIKDSEIERLQVRKKEGGGERASACVSLSERGGGEV